MGKKICGAVIVAVLILSTAGTCRAKDPRLSQVTTIYVGTDNAAADIARKLLAGRRTCFRLASSISEATATLDVWWGLDVTRVESFDPLGGAAIETRVRGQLSDPAGDLLWERSHVSTGGREVAVRELLFSLAKATGCRKASGLVLGDLTMIAVRGRGHAATTIRNRLRKGKVCLQLTETEADATLIVEESAEHNLLGMPQAVVFGSLILSDGETAWSAKTKGSPTPFGGMAAAGKEAGRLLLRRLAKDAQCKKRKKK